ncbi:MAG: metal ABC transporter substrate-binding protein, partial [Pseudomonadota bacterium]|nr:metal ABC transporter substrate-binding protein [Pseudomonadota bacterium]
ADTVRAYQEADLILLNGAGYAKWTAKVSLPRFKLVDTSRAFRDRYIHTEGPATHSHGPDGDHSHAGIAFTTWLDFTQAAQQAKAITEALVRKRPELRSELERRVAELEEDLMALENRLRAIVAGKPGQPLVASHPVYQYLARRYGLNLQSLMWEPEEIPGADQWHGLEQRLRDHPALWMLWEDNPNPVSVQRLDTLGVGSLVFAPAGNRPAEGDFMTLMRRNLDNLEQAFR